jgi:hypothetical protein
MKFFFLPSVDLRVRRQEFDVKSGYLLVEAEGIQGICYNLKKKKQDKQVLNVKSGYCYLLVECGGRRVVMFRAFFFCPHVLKKKKRLLTSLRWRVEGADLSDSFFDRIFFLTPWRALTFQIFVLIGVLGKQHRGAYDTYTNTVRILKSTLHIERVLYRMCSGNDVSLRTPTPCKF